MKRTMKALRSEPSVALLVAAIAAGLVLGARALGVSEPVELFLYDRLLALRPAG